MITLGTRRGSVGAQPIARRSSERRADSVGSVVAHSPITAEDRIQVLDVLRGFALLGILLANMPFYANPITATMLGEATGGPDRIVSALVRLLVEAKFYCLFSLLFGIGLFVQMTRAEAHGAPFARLHARRLLALGAIGVAHAFLLWSGDILTTYAILGGVLLAFRTRRPTTLAVWALAVLLVPLVYYATSAVVTHLGTDGGTAAARAERLAQLTARSAHDWQVYGHGSFAEVTLQRIRDFRLLLPSLVYMASGMFCMFLTGLWLARRGVLQDLRPHRRWFVRIVAVCAPLGLAANALVVIGRDRAGDLAWRLVTMVMRTVGAPMLCFAYAAGIALLVTSERWRRRLAPLGAAGRMPLTSYLLQSLVCTTVFYGYGLGFLGRVGIADGAALALLLWTAQLALSTLWLRHFAYGPAEWLWRALTYGRVPTMRRRSAGAVLQA